ncbi:MAG: VCBS repeat-containing protein, partial [Chloroflexi bacterium]|nr:VCBS repeat-containing protein [Chloroflexota bacterium]
FSVPVDWDGDGDLEIVAGNRVYQANGTLVASFSGGSQWPAIGDFDADGRPDVVTTGNGTATLHLNDGTIGWSVSVPGGGGGPPTVADFDRDGEPEVGVAGRSKYTVFETDGTVRWSNDTQDASSSVTGSSVFDFEGEAEVVYADEHDLWVYAGKTGSVLLRMADHGSGTLYEYPVIADVDGDGATEIVVPSNNMWWGVWTGITIVGDVDESWAPARPTWSQYAYHITNVDSDGGIPTNQTQNWTSWNSFRAGGTELGPSHWRPDLRPVKVETCLDDCDQGLVHLTLSVANEGLVESGAFDLQFTRYDGAVDVRSEVGTSVSSGWAEWQGPWTFTKEEWDLAFAVTVDSTNAVEECDEDDNFLAIGDWPCP